MVMFVFNFMNQIFLKSMFSEEDKVAVIEFLCEKNDIDTYQRIRDDFIFAVNECIRNRKIKIIDRKKAYSLKSIHIQQLQWTTFLDLNRKQFRK